MRFENGLGEGVGDGGDRKPRIQPWALNVRRSVYALHGGAGCVCEEN